MVDDQEADSYAHRNLLPSTLPFSHHKPLAGLLSLWDASRVG